MLREALVQISCGLFACTDWEVGRGGSWFPFATPVEYVFAPPSPLPTVVLLSLFHHSIPVEHSTNSMAETVVTVETENGNRDSRDSQG